MKSLKNQWVLAGVFLLISIVTYVIHYFIFLDVRNIFFYMVMDIGFLPLQVLILTLFINRVLNEREKSRRLEKLNMVIGAFFSEAGRDLLRMLSLNNPRTDAIKERLLITRNWTPSRFKEIKAELERNPLMIGMDSLNMDQLHLFLKGHRDFLLRMLTNPNLLEHESFTEMLRAIFHLTEELLSRKVFTALTDHDIEHLKNDISRAYQSLILEWIDYMHHLKNHFPYLFSFALRTNPFDGNASVFIS